MESYKKSGSVKLCISDRHAATVSDLCRGLAVHAALLACPATTFIAKAQAAASAWEGASQARPCADTADPDCDPWKWLPGAVLAAGASAQPCVTIGEGFQLHNCAVCADATVREQLVGNSLQHAIMAEFVEAISRRGEMLRVPEGLPLTAEQQSDRADVQAFAGKHPSFREHLATLDADPHSDALGLLDDGLLDGLPAVPSQYELEGSQGLVLDVDQPLPIGHRGVASSMHPPVAPGLPPGTGLGSGSGHSEACAAPWPAVGNGQRVSVVSMQSPAVATGAHAARGSEEQPRLGIECLTAAVGSLVAPASAERRSEDSGEAAPPPGVNSTPGAEPGGCAPPAELGVLPAEAAADSLSLVETGAPGEPLGPEEPGQAPAAEAGATESESGAPAESDAMRRGSREEDRGLG